MLNRTHRFAARLSIAAAAALGCTLLTAATLEGAPADAQATRPAAAVSVHDSAPATTVDSKTAPRPRFPGHRPGRIYLGMSCGLMCNQKIPQLRRSFGVHRIYRKWGDWRSVGHAIDDSRRHDRLPWISIEGPGRGSPYGWRAVARGEHDRQIRALARKLKAHDRKPVFISFDHEPSNKAPGSQGRWWAHGYNRFYDVLKRAHALRHVAVPPIMAEWMFNKYNREDRPGQWLKPGVLRRAPFLGVDIYEGESGLGFAGRLPRILRWLDKHGHPHMMLGIAECGATAAYKSTTPARWINRSLRWSAEHRRRMVAVAYYNSTAFSGSGLYWPLDESRRKMRAFRRWLSIHPFISHVR